MTRGSRASNRNSLPLPDCGCWARTSQGGRSASAFSLYNCRGRDREPKNTRLVSDVTGNLIISCFLIPAFASMRRYSHKIPVQLLRGHLLQQRLQTAFEEHLKAEVVLNDKGGLQTAICNLDVAQISKPQSNQTEEIAGVQERPRISPPSRCCNERGSSPVHL